MTLSTSPVSSFVHLLSPKFANLDLEFPTSSSPPSSFQFASAVSMVQFQHGTDPIVQLPPSPKDDLLWANTVIGKIIDDRGLSTAEVEDAVNNIWVKRADIRVSRLKDFFLFHCSNAQDTEDLIQLENVVIMGVLLVLKRRNPCVPPEEWCLNDTALWVQIHGVPTTHFNSQVALKLAELLGQAVDVDLQHGQKRGILRVKVRIDLDQPVLSGVYFDAGEEGTVRWVSFHYENVCRLCKNCRRLGHLAESCLVPVETARASTTTHLYLVP